MSLLSNQRSNRGVLVVACLTATVGFLAPKASAQVEVNDVQKLISGSAPSGTQLGRELDVEDDVLVAGCPSVREVFLFKRTGSLWSNNGSLVPSSGNTSDLYGYSIDVQGPDLAVSAPRDDDVANNAGAVYVYEYGGSNWLEQAKLTAADGATGDRFGEDVHLRGNVLFVGATLASDGTAETGAVYVFERVGFFWFQQDKILPPRGVDQEAFGGEITSNGDRLFISAPQRNSPNDMTSAGTVYVYSVAGTSTSFLQRIDPPSPGLNAAFGASMAVSGSTLLVGEPRADAPTLDSGAVHVYDGTGPSWTPVETLTSSALGFEGGYFGNAVAIEGDRMAIGAPRMDVACGDCGTVFQYILREGEWVVRTRLSASDAETNDQLGSTLVFTSSGIAAGAPNEDGPQVFDRGAIYISRIDPAEPVQAFCFGDGTGTPCPCGNTGAPGHGCDNSLGTGGGLLDADGDALTSYDSLVLAATDLGPSAPALYFQGTADVNGGPGLSFGDGLRCAGGTNLRLGTKGSVNGASQYPEARDEAVSEAGFVPVTGGQRVYQVWYRNNADFCDPGRFNLTNALRVTWVP